MLLAELKAQSEDFEWYPTTDEIIKQVARDIHDVCFVENHGYYDLNRGDLLDVGAGDGRVLVKLKELAAEACDFDVIENLFAIEKSSIHLRNMPKDIVTIGTDFSEQTLLDKSMRFVFCNPPYSEYEEWMLKVVREVNAKYVYMVIPRRWREAHEIKMALDKRDADVTSLGEFDFENAERRARAKVEVVRITFGYDKRDAFDSMLEEMLPELEEFDRDAALEDVSKGADAIEIAVSSDNLIESLVMAYDKEVADMLENYRTAMRLSTKVLMELGVNKEAVLKGIRSKITGLKNEYWKVLFERFSPITTRLATKQRKSFLDSLNGKATIDFTEGNIYSMLIWITKWANDYFDEQLIDLFKAMAEHCNVTNYKSNHRTWKKGDWRYTHNDTPHTHYKLEYRIVVDRTGGICTSPWSWEREQNNGLTTTACEFISDCITVANNLGFASSDTPRNHTWVSNLQNKIMLDNGDTLVAARAFKNGNLHMHFNQKIMLAINVEAGRLLGWLKSPEDAVSEMQLTGEDADFVHEKFGTSFRIEPKNVLKLSYVA